MNGISRAKQALVLTLQNKRKKKKVLLSCKLKSLSTLILLFNGKLINDIAPQKHFGLILDI